VIVLAFGSTFDTGIDMLSSSKSEDSQM
jgi:hypothetical protein